MNSIRTIALSLLVALGLGAAAAPAPNPNYYVMRHLQKATGDDPGLTPAGRVNARRLALRFGPYPPTAIYVSDTRRARETAAPTASRFRLSPKVYDPSDTPALIARVRSEPGTVLIVGHSNTVPDIVERLGGPRPAAIPEDRFGDIWRIWGPQPRTKRTRPFP